MTNQYVEDRIKMTIDQFYAHPNKRYIEECQLDYIGGILQTALHLLPTDRYYAVKQYIYDKHGYDPGGVRTGQISMEDLLFDVSEGRIT